MSNHSPDQMTRYDFQMDYLGNCYCDISEQPEGDYVEYEKAEKIITELQEQIAVLDDQYQVVCAENKKLIARIGGEG